MLDLFLLKKEKNIDHYNGEWPTKEEKQTKNMQRRNPMRNWSNKLPIFSGIPTDTTPNLPRQSTSGGSMQKSDKRAIFCKGRNIFHCKIIFVQQQP
jgi:hypothetical protein